MVIAIASQKGGTGKSSTSISLAAGLARRGQKALLVDIDSQANSSKVLIPNYLELRKESTIYVTILKREPLPIHHTSVANLDIIDDQITSTQEQLNRLLVLYLSGEFAKEILSERKARLEKTLDDLSVERTQMAAQLQSTEITDEQIAEIEAFCATAREGLDNATFEDKRRYFELLDVRGKLAFENGEKVVYVTCLIGKQRLVQMPTSHSRSNRNGLPFIITQRLVIAPSFVHA